MGNICGAPRGSKDDIDGQANIDSKRIGKKGAVSTHYISSNYKKASLENDVPQTKMIFQDNKKVSQFMHSSFFRKRSFQLHKLLARKTLLQKKTGRRQPLSPQSKPRRQRPKL